MALSRVRAQILDSSKSSGCAGRTALRSALGLLVENERGQRQRQQCRECSFWWVVCPSSRCDLLTRCPLVSAASRLSDASGGRFELLGLQPNLCCWCRWTKAGLIVWILDCTWRRRCSCLADWKVRRMPRSGTPWSDARRFGLVSAARSLQVWVGVCSLCEPGLWQRVRFTRRLTLKSQASSPSIAPIQRLPPTWMHPQGYSTVPPCAAIRIEDKRDRRITLYHDPLGQRARMHGDWNTASRCSRFFRLGLSTFSLGDERVDDQVLAVSSRSSTVRSAIFSASLSGISPSRHACSDLGIDQRFGKKNYI